MARSACPLLCWYRGLLVTCSMSHNCENVRNSVHDNWGQLSETNTSDETWRANCDRIVSMTHVARVFEPSRPTKISYSSSLRVEGSADLVTQTSQHHLSPMVDQEPRDTSGGPCTAPDDMCCTHCTGWRSLWFVGSSVANTRHPLPDECNPVCRDENGEPWR